MPVRISPYTLGATLYMPVLRPDIAAIASGQKLPGLRSLVLCLEDALAEQDVADGLDRLRLILRFLHEQPANAPRPLVFVRPRHAEMAKLLADEPDIEAVDGFVAPKVTPGSVGGWADTVRHRALLLMPTLETREMFDPLAVRDLRDELLAEARDHILALRIGGNDLMNCLGVRRQRGQSLYDGPLHYVLSMLIGQMIPAGFALTAPVNEILDDPDTLWAEARQDADWGLVGKTAVHPSQIATIHTAFQVSGRELDTARRIVARDAAAVFRHDGAMCEPSTHRHWADRILERERIFGAREDEGENLEQPDRDVAGL